MLKKISMFIGSNCATIKTGFMQGYHESLHADAIAKQNDPGKDDSPGLTDEHIEPPVPSATSC